MQMKSALVLTGSRGHQEETAVPVAPYLGARENTERPTTIEYCFNRLTGARKEPSLELWNQCRADRQYQIPPLWDAQEDSRRHNGLRRILLAKCAYELQPQ